MDSETLWTIAELGEQVAEALATGYDAPENRQVRAVPNQRTIRYYTTLGLLDRPTQMRGRTALYDRTHLCQLVAVKRLQADGKTLADIQRELAGADPAEIARIARLDTATPVARPATTRTSFWLDAPAEPAPASEPPASPPASAPPSAPAPAPAPSPTPTPLSALELAPGVTLLIDSRVIPHTPEYAALLRAAEPLLVALHSGKPNRPA